jgi:K+-transporting ATPase KdpF subunit
MISQNPGRGSCGEADGDGFHIRNVDRRGLRRHARLRRGNGAAREARMTLIQLLATLAAALAAYLVYALLEAEKF